MNQVEKLNSYFAQHNKFEDEFQLIIELIVTHKPCESELMSIPYVKLLTQVKKRIESEFLYEKINYCPIDKIRIESALIDNHPNTPIEVIGTATINTELVNSFQDIIILGVCIDSKWKPIPINNMIHDKVINWVSSIIFIYPNYDVIIEYNSSNELKAHHLNPFRPKYWNSVTPYGDVNTIIQFGYLTDPLGIDRRITGQAIKSMWILNLEMTQFSNAYNKCNRNDILPNIGDMLYRIFCRRILHTFAPTKLSVCDMSFYAPHTTPYEILYEMYFIFIQRTRPMLISKSYLMTFVNIISNIGGMFNPNHIIEIICCMEYLGGDFRDLIQIMFEIIILI